MARTASPTPGTTSRTRRAILDAAYAVLSEDSNASMSDVAKAAEVGRSTLHRYFPDRAALVRALFSDASHAMERTILEAALEQDTPRAAFRRLIRALFELGPRVNFLFTESQFSEGVWDDTAWEAAHTPVGALYERGRREGCFDSEVDVDWFIRVLWYLISAGWEAVSDGTLAKHEALDKTTRTLERGLIAHDD